MKKRGRAAARRHHQSPRHRSRRTRRSAGLESLETSTQIDPTHQAVCPNCNAPLPFSRYLGAPAHCTEPALHLKEVVSLLYDPDRPPLIPWSLDQQRDSRLWRCPRIFHPYERQMAKRTGPARRSDVIMRADSASLGIEPYVSDELIAELLDTEQQPSPVEPYILDDILPEYMETELSQPEAEQDVPNLCPDLLSSSWLYLKNDVEEFEKDDDFNTWTLVGRISNIPGPPSPQTGQDSQTYLQSGPEASQYGANVVEKGSHVPNAVADDWWGWH